MSLHREVAHALRKKTATQSIVCKQFVVYIGPPDLGGYSFTIILVVGVVGNAITLVEQVAGMLGYIGMFGRSRLATHGRLGTLSNAGNKI